MSNIRVKQHTIWLQCPDPCIQAVLTVSASTTDDQYGISAAAERANNRSPQVQDFDRRGGVGRRAPVDMMVRGLATACALLVMLGMSVTYDLADSDGTMLASEDSSSSW